MHEVERESCTTSRQRSIVPHAGSRLLCTMPRFTREISHSSRSLFCLVYYPKLIFEQVSTTSSATSRKHGCHSCYYIATSIPPRRIFHDASPRLHTIQTTCQSCAKAVKSSVLATVSTTQSIELASLWSWEHTRYSSTSSECSIHEC